jgi:hypothetical protein
MHREPLRDGDYWEKWVPYCAGRIKDRQEKLLVNPFPEKWKRNSITQTLFYDCKDLIYLKYSAGINVAEIKDDFAQVVDAWGAYNQNISTGDNKKHLLMFTDYHRVLTLVSWAILFDAPIAQFETIANHIHSLGDDGLMEVLLSSKLDGRIQTNQLVYPEVFGLLFDATQKKGEEQINLLKTYLGNWYNHMRKAGWYDIHKAKGEGSFVGYWCFEVAAVVKLYGIDDTSFREMDFYPKQMIDFALNS